MPTLTSAPTAEAEPPKPSARNIPPDTYITLSGIDWQTFEGIADRTRGGRVTYRDGDLEIMSPSIHHEGFGGSLIALVDALCEALGMESIEIGSTTWKAPAALKGIEADASFYLDPAKLPVVEGLKATGEKDITRYPAPDLVGEIDLRRADAERLAVYAAIGAVEVWEFDGEAIRIWRLGHDGSYTDLPRSGWFPISAQEIASAIIEAPGGTMARRRMLRALVARLIAKGEADRTE